MRRTITRALLAGTMLVGLSGAARAENTPTRSQQHDGPADNTGRNVRDRDDASPTPMDQGGSETDRKITQAIRRSVVDRDDLSMNAHNVKIITREGVVTLRGPVNSPQERSTVASLAKQASGVKRVDDQLEVTPAR